MKLPTLPPTKPKELMNMSIFYMNDRLVAHGVVEAKHTNRLIDYITALMDEWEEKEQG